MIFEHFTDNFSIFIFSFSSRTCYAVAHCKLAPPMFLMPHTSSLNKDNSIAHYYRCAFTAGLPLQTRRGELGLLFVLEPLRRHEKCHYAHIVAATRHYFECKDEEQGSWGPNPYFCKNDSCTSRCAVREKAVFPSEESSCSCAPP